MSSTTPGDDGWIEDPTIDQMTDRRKVEEIVEPSSENKHGRNPDAGARWVSHIRQHCELTDAEAALLREQGTARNRRKPIRLHFGYTDKNYWAAFDAYVESFAYHNSSDKQSPKLDREALITLIAKCFQDSALMEPELRDEDARRDRIEKALEWIITQKYPGFDLDSASGDSD